MEAYIDGQVYWKVFLIPSYDRDKNWLRYGFKVLD